MDGSKRKVGILGGTFNPPHVGHLMLAEWAREAAGLDEVLFLPTGSSYMKEESEIEEGRARLDMVGLSIQGNPYFHASGMEIARGGPTYTYETMEQVRKEHPDWELYFIMGADCLFSIEEWKSPERIFASCRIIASVRDGLPMDRLKDKRQELQKKYGAKIQLLNFPSIGLSSTEIRSRIRAGQSVRYMVPENVLQYIEENHLYHDKIYHDKIYHDKI